MNKKGIVISSGDPAGCGPLITLKAINEFKGEQNNFFVVGDKKLLERYPIYEKIKGKIELVDLNTKNINRIKIGYLSKITGLAGLSYLQEALKLLKYKGIQHLVTAPLSKEAAKLIMPKFSGHTEYLADYFKIKKPVMMMVSPKLKVVLLSRHIPLRKAISSLDKNDILDCFSLVYLSLIRQFQLKNPKIACISLNPHAGVNTFLDKEEKEILKAITEFKKPIYGPYPADTIFTKENLKNYDCLICAYHDQAMIPFKLLWLPEGVNVTLGLPIVRTSPAHGVAYEIMRQGKVPFHSSMTEAIKLALKLSP